MDARIRWYEAKTFRSKKVKIAMRKAKAMWRCRTTCHVHTNDIYRLRDDISLALPCMRAPMAQELSCGAGLNYTPGSDSSAWSASVSKPPPGMEFISLREFEAMHGLSITAVAQVSTASPHATAPGCASACCVVEEGSSGSASAGRRTCAPRSGNVMLESRTCIGAGSMSVCSSSPTTPPSPSSPPSPRSPVLDEWDRCWTMRTVERFGLAWQFPEWISTETLPPGCLLRGKQMERYRALVKYKQCKSTCTCGK